MRFDCHFLELALMLVNVLRFYAKEKPNEIQEANYSICIYVNPIN